MLILLSPSKTLDEKTANHNKSSKAAFLDRSVGLAAILKKMDTKKIGKLMHLNDKLAELNCKRYHDFAAPFTDKNAYTAIFLFKGNVYDGLDIKSFSESQLESADKHIRILSGLYGILRPFDLIMPYRLEMGTSLANKNGRDLYKFWGDDITNRINEEESQVIFNLASGEYYKAVKPAKLKARVITPVFKEKKPGGYKMIMPYVKKARGLMAAYIIKNNISDIDDAKSFNMEGYKFNSELSGMDDWVFTRG